MSDDEDDGMDDIDEIDATNGVDDDEVLVFIVVSIVVFIVVGWGLIVWWWGVVNLGGLTNKHTNTTIQTTELKQGIREKKFWNQL